MAAIEGLSDGSGIPVREILEGYVMPDTLLWVVSRAIGVSGAPAALRHRLELGLGCSSAIAWGGATADGKLLHGRNFDYHGVAPWPRETAVIFHEPEHGLRYVSIASAGVILGGVTAMNEAGLTLTVHQHMFTGKTRLGGVPIGVVGDEIMRRAHSLDEAEAILAANRPIGCWTYLIADGRRREVLCWEENPERRARFRFREEGTFGYANIYLDRALGASEADWYPSYWRHNQGRYERLRARLAEARGRIDPGAIASILGDTGEGDCRLSRAIAMLMTVGSVVFQPEDGIVWVATGKAPTSHGRFEPFDLAREDYAPERGALTGGVPQDRDAAAAFEAYRDAYLAYFDGDDLAEARRLLARACALQPREPLYWVLACLLGLADADGRSALDAIERALAIGHRDPERIAAARLWRARALDLLGERERALSDYRAVLDAPRRDRQHARAAERGLVRPYRAREARRLPIDFAFADVVAP
jgi:tetratricopeptide (TPR) repeat protein